MIVVRKFLSCPFVVELYTLDLSDLVAVDSGVEIEG